MPSEIDLPRARGNLLLASLPRAELGDLLERAKLAHHRIKDVLYEAGGSVTQVHFPLSGVVSLVTVADGAVVEVATVGSEGMVGVPLFLGSGGAGNTRAVAQVPGESVALSARGFRACLERSRRLWEVVGAYVELLLVQSAQSVACNRLHPVEERLSRWLLLSADRAGGEEFPLTHEFLAQMLGVRRASVTVSAGMLQQAGLITYRRGRVAILDRAGLEAASCSCTRVIRAAQERLLPSSSAWKRRR